MTISPAEGNWVPDACTLPTVEQPIRVAEFGRFFAESVRRPRRSAPTVLEVVADPGAEPVARDLAARESRCCSFFGFEFASTDAELVMQVGVPDVYVGVLDAFAGRVEAASGGNR
ncbi:hypothetical protein [Nocardia miyunensis]|uniref:hypothetical protein n=1 Tax=Nocardia miyunensis TaxID=282684 RepID=UPI000829BA53|nr:hypothetical protein [Nocardia miyunensis]